MHTLTLTTEELEAVYDALTSVPEDDTPLVDSAWRKVREALTGE